jgi:hypothetical protein
VSDTCIVCRALANATRMSRTVEGAAEYGACLALAAVALFDRRIAGGLCPVHLDATETLAGELPPRPPN